MVKEQDELPETIKCTKKDCQFDIPVIDCYHVHSAETPQISVKCPECNKVMTLSKAKTIAYANEYPQIQQDIDSEVGYKTKDISEIDDIGDMLMQALDVFGYTQTKHTQMKKMLRAMVDRMPKLRSNPDELWRLLRETKGITAEHALRITQFIFSGDQTADEMYGILSPQMPYQPPIGQPQMPYQQQMPPQMPYQQQMPPQMPYQQQMPQPAYQNPQPMPPQMPYQQPQPAPPPATGDDGITIIEKIGDDGQVIERVIKQPKPVDAPTDGTAPPANMAEQLKEVIEVMSEAGMIRSTEPEPQPTIEDIVEHIVPLLEKPEPDDKYDKISGEISALRDLIEVGKEDKLNARFDGIEARIANSGKEGMTDSQHSDVIRKDIETARIDALTESMNTVVKPLVEMQATQAKFQTMMMVRQVEQQDHAAPGTYVQMFAPTTVSDESVQTDLGKWRGRAGRAGATA